MRKLIALLSIVFSVPALAQVYPYFPPPGISFANKVMTGSIKPIFNIATYGAKCDGATDDSAAINSAEAAAAAAGGGIVYGSGTCAVASSLIYNDSRIVFSAANFGNGIHDVGSNDQGWTLKWTGSAGGTIMQIAAPVGASNQALYGNGVEGVTFDCNNSAGIGLQVESVKGGYWYGLYFNECTTAGLDAIPVSSLGEASDIQGNVFLDIRTRILLSNGIGIRLRGVSGHNTSFDTFGSLTIEYKTGIGIQLQNTDNLFFYNIQGIQATGGTANGIDLSGDTSGSANSIFFYNVSPGAGGVLIEGTGTIPTAVKNVQFIGYDISNNPPSPVLGTGVTGITTYKENGHFSGSGMINGAFGGNDSELSSAITSCGASDPLCIYSGSQAGIRLADGTGTWIERQDSSHDLQIVRSAGTGNVLVPFAVITPPLTTVAGLPTCNAATKGEIYEVSDASAPTYNGTLTGGGTVMVIVMCNGTAWVSQ